MDDLGSALASNDEVIMLGGGNPSYIPRMQVYFRERMRDILENDRQFEHIVGPFYASDLFKQGLASQIVIAKEEDTPALI